MTFITASMFVPLLLVLIITLLTYSPVASDLENTSVISDQDTTLSSDDMVLLFIDSMRSGDFAKLLETEDILIWGYCPDYYNTSNLNNSNVDNLEVSKYTSNLELLGAQADFVRACFGEDAWEKVSYEFVRANATSVHEVFINTDTNAEITYDEYQQLYYDYWLNFTVENGIDYVTFFDLVEFSGLLDDFPVKNIQWAEFKGYAPPIRIDLASDYDCFEVYFKFGENDAAITGESKFHITIDNSIGSYKLSRGLMWDIPIIYRPDHPD